MGITKKIKLDSLFSLQSVFLFLFLVLFPFGQIIRLSFGIGSLNMPLQPIDVVVGLGALYSILFEKEKPKVYKYLKYFLVAAGFSFILSVFIFKYQVLYGLFYLVRIVAYTFFLNYVWNFAKKSSTNGHLLSSSLLTISVISAVFGWIQLFVFPDIKPFFVYGWDMHLFRLVGTFLDPTFLGLIIVFGLLLSINRFIDSREKKYLLITVFLLVSLAFTYSRASYLAFLGGIFVIAFAEKKFRKMMVLAVTFLIFALLLPTAKNHSIELTRSFSIIARLDNYKETIEVFKKFPVFGVGFNNLCIARNKYIGVESFTSHACSGSDSSLLLILATTGTIGLMVFAGSILGVFKSLPKSREAQTVIAVSMALFIHSLFSNSLFFPWIMGYVVILLAVSVKE